MNSKLNLSSNILLKFDKIKRFLVFAIFICGNVRKLNVEEISKIDMHAGLKKIIVNLLWRGSKLVRIMKSKLILSGSMSNMKMK